MSIGSLFTGVGGLDLGLERARLGPVRWQVEIDPYCQRVLAAHWPEATRHADIKTVGRHNLSPVAVLCGGFPCQDVSVAGRGAGLAGERSGLWREFARIISELEPAWVVIENVAHGRGRWLPAVRRDLCDLGYSSGAFGVSAADVGAPHERRRVFVLAHADREPLRQQPEWLSGGRARALRGGGEDEPGDDGANGAVAGRHHRAGLPRPRVGDPVDGLPRRMAGRWPAGPGEEPFPWEAPRSGQAPPLASPGREALRALGNAVVPACAEAAGRLLLSAQ